MQNYFKIWMLERRFKKLHRERVTAFVRGDPLRLKAHLVGQMQILIKVGVLPSWENFCQYGDNWKRMSRYFTARDARIYEAEWRKLSGKTLDEHWGSRSE